MTKLECIGGPFDGEHKLVVALDRELLLTSEFGTRWWYLPVVITLRNGQQQWILKCQQPRPSLGA